MAYDIGPKIGIDGEEAFRRQLREISANLKTMGSEMKVVTATFKGNEDSMEALTARNEVLGKTIEELNKKLKTQEKFVSDNKDKLSESAEASAKWERALNESRAEIITLERELKQNNERLEEMRREAANAGDAVENLGDESKRAAKSMDDAGGAAINFGEAVKASFLGNLAADVAKSFIGTLINLAQSMVNLDKETESYRAEQAMLLSSFEANKLGADNAKKAYTGLFGIIGDSDEATEASQLLSNLAKNTEDIDKWLKISAGSWGKYGKSLPLTSLIEAANEAAKTGESVSVLNDAISWSGGDTAKFEEALKGAANEAERAVLISDTLVSLLGESAEAYERNNAELIKQRGNQVMLNDTMAKLGESVGKVKAELGEDFIPIFSEAGNAFADMLTKTEGAEERFSNAIMRLVEKGGEEVGNFAKVGIEAFAKILEGLTSEENRGTVSTALRTAIETISEGLKENSGEMIVAGTLLMGELLVGLLQGIASIVTNIPGMIDDVKEAFRENKDVFTELGKEMGQAFIDALKSMFNLVDQLFGAYETYGINWGPSPAIRPTQQATGVYNVPYDGFLTSLHEGEMVLTRKQAEFVRANGVNNTGVQTMTESVINTMAALSGGSVSDVPITIILQLPDGDEFARAQLPSLIRVAEANGTPIVMQ